LFIDQHQKTLTLKDWLHYLESFHANDVTLGLHRVTTVAARLGVLEWDLPIITVAGTNGKGSTVAALEAIYCAAGYQVASYTSPHLIAFNERIRVNQCSISDDDLCMAFMAMASARGDTPLTYFEMTTIAALWHFKQCSLDVILLEVGMGGRWDATNIIDSDVAIITTIDFDHQAHLGHTLEAIGYEKAGILRNNQPWVYGDVHPPVSILTEAMRLNTTQYQLGVDYSFQVNNNDWLLNLPCGQEISLPLPKINLKSAAAAIVASQCLQGDLSVTQTHLECALREVSMVGRQQVVVGSTTTILDVSHNPQAVVLLAEFVRQSVPKGRVHAIFSGLKDKDLSGLIQPMLCCVDVWYPCLLSGPRAASESQIMGAFPEDNGFVMACFPEPLKAYDEALQRAGSDDLIVVYGSFLTVSAIIVGDGIAQENE
jgi:dihydrofolate synthase/folylpolyglutamate synthase